MPTTETRAVLQPSLSNDAQILRSALRLLQIKRDALSKQQQRIERALLRLDIAERVLAEVNSVASHAIGSDPEAKVELTPETGSRNITRRPEVNPKRARSRMPSKRAANPQTASLGSGGKIAKVDDEHGNQEEQGYEQLSQISNKRSEAGRMPQIAMAVSILLRQRRAMTRAEIIEAIRLDYGRVANPKSLSVLLNRAAGQGFVKRAGNTWKLPETTEDEEHINPT